AAPWDFTANLGGQLSLKPSDFLTVTFRATVTTLAATGPALNTAFVSATDLPQARSNTITHNVAGTTATLTVAADSRTFLESAVASPMNLSALSPAGGLPPYTITVTRLPNRTTEGEIRLANGHPAYLGRVLTVTELRNLTWTGAKNFNGSTLFEYSVADSSTPVQRKIATVPLTVTAVNDPPVAYPDDGYFMQARPAARTTLTAAMNTTQTTATVVSTRGYPSAGALRIDNEVVTYSGVTATQFTGLTRAVAGTTAATHNVGAGAFPTATLTTAMTATDVQALVASTLVYPTSGALGMELTGTNREVFTYSDVSATGFLSLSRGDWGSAAPHAVGVEAIPSLLIDPPPVDNDADVDGALDGATLRFMPGAVSSITVSCLDFQNQARGTGTFEVDANGAVRFTPDPGCYGTASTSYRVSDDGTGVVCTGGNAEAGWSSCGGVGVQTSNTSTLAVRVNAAPVAVNDAWTVRRGGSGRFDVTANDSDPDGAVDVTVIDLDPSTRIIDGTRTVSGGTFSTNSANGEVLFVSDGTVPAVNPIVLNYAISDYENGVSNWAQITVTVTSCSTSADCGDDDACTSDVCTNGICSNPFASQGTSCSDANPATRNDVCDGAGRCAGTPYTCTPGQCELTSVPNGSGCTTTPRMNGTSCNDGNACTQTDSCQAGVCTGSNPVVCTPSSQCHDAGVCNPSTGICSNPPKVNGAACNDGNACTQTDTCQSGTCTGGNPVVCTPSSQCHD
ncbi:MAG: Ig-like domain-containing protein, partial [Myxococcales bacterium]